MDNMDFDQNFKVVFVNCEEIALDFFINKLGFKLCEEIEMRGKTCTILQVNENDFLMLVEKEEIDKELLVLKTDDCLRDYSLFKQKSIATLTKPRYVDKGLELCFSDPSGNQFILLEERDYTDV